MDKSKVEQLTAGIVTRLQRAHGNRSFLDPAIFAAIAAAIVQVIEAIAQCQNQSFSEVARRPIFNGEIRAKLIIRGQLREHRIFNVRPPEVYTAAVEEIAVHPDDWLDEMATEPQMPDWGV